MTAAVASTMRACGHLEAARVWGAQAVCALNAIPAAAWIAAHGAAAYGAAREQSFQLARAARTAADGPPLCAVDGTPWYDIILAPLQRRAGSRAAP